MNSTAATFASPAPQRQTTNEAMTPWAEIIFAGFFAAIGFLIFCWLLLVFIFYQAGYRHPGEAAAEAALTIGSGALIIAGIVFVSLRLLGPLFGGIADLINANIEAKVQIKELEYSFDHRLPATVAAASTNEQQRLYHATIEAMRRGYERIDESGKLRGSSVQPWSRRSIGRLHLPLEATKVGENTNLAGSVKSFLLDKGILLNDTTININEFDDINAVKLILDKELGRSIRLGGGGGMSGNYIKKGEGESWA